ncbi:DUF2269 family protein [Chungangia koreensis]|uniref:DUF2269 family protein n=1 Tax=Chungangia koreensis TaxID=752657 RepID=A0ABV8X6Z3_9LACT
MSTFYSVLVFIHIFSAIMGMGPGFILNSIPKSAKTMTELRNAYAIKNRVHIFVMVGGTLLLVTGLLMGFLNPYLFGTGWYWLSLGLYLAALAMGPFVLKPISTPIKQMLKEHSGEEIPAQYFLQQRKLTQYEHVINLLFILVIALMILKPF